MSRSSVTKHCPRECALFRKHKLTQRLYTKNIQVSRFIEEEGVEELYTQDDLARLEGIFENQTLVSAPELPAHLANAPRR